MDKKLRKGGMHTNPRMVQGTTLRDEIIGKKRVDVSSMLRMEHLQKLATWASVEAGIPPLGALFGYRLAANAEAEGVPLDPSTLACERCESILQPGVNCLVRIEKIARKATQNNVVYKCNFCSHPNIRRGTQRGYIKGLLASKQRALTDPNVQCSSITIMKKSDRVGTDPNAQCSLTTIMNKSGRVLEDNETLEKNGGNESSLDKSPLTPLLDRLMNSSKRKRKKSGSNSANNCIPSNSVEGTGCGSGSTKRKRKGWSSLKEIAMSNEAQSSRSICNFAVPFLFQPGR